MNLPSALFGAMNQDRKPFTYTPGGLDLSQIKSQRMVQRLKRNAMNPGVTEVQQIQPSTAPSVPIVLPNYKCLPVQVFPVMPSNPKTLLRSISNNSPRDARVQRPISSSVSKSQMENNDTLYNSSRYSREINRQISEPEYFRLSTNNTKATKWDNRNEPVFEQTSLFKHTPTVAAIPSPMQLTPATVYSNIGASTFTPVSSVVPTSVLIPTSIVTSELDYKPEFYSAPMSYGEQTNELLYKGETRDKKDKVPTYGSVETSIDLTLKPLKDDKETTLQEEKLTFTNNVIQDPVVNLVPADTLQEKIINSTPLVSKLIEENADIDNEQSEVKVIKKKSVKENKIEEHNGEKNGDTNGEAETTIKLPSKKSAAKTETKVEVEKKVLPDGSIEEVKTTTTRTTIDGRTEIKTKTETKITPKQEEYEEEIEEEEEEEEEDQEAVEQSVQESKEKVTEENDEAIVTQNMATPKKNGAIVKTEERSETKIAKKVVVLQEVPQTEQTEEIEEEEETEEEEVEETPKPVTAELKKTATPLEEEEEEEEEEEYEEEEHVEEKRVAKQLEQEKQVTDQEEIKEDSDVQSVEEEVLETKKTEAKEEVKAASKDEPEEEEEEEEEYEDDEEKEKQECELKSEEKTEVKEIKEHKQEIIEEVVKEEIATETSIEEPKEVQKEEEHVTPLQSQKDEEPKIEQKEHKPEEKPTRFTVPIREPSVPLEKVEDVEIKPIGSTPLITKSHTENTEITTSAIDPSGGISRQTEYNKIENIVTVNRTTKILDHSYENITQQGIPTVKTYFPPPSIDRINQSPMPSRPYQPVYTPEATTERRHSLLLERLSVDRQLPTDVYQYSNQSYEQTQYQDEPQSEVLTVSNVKPSTITNQQWYQQTKQTQNVLYNNVTSNPTPGGAPWAQPKSTPTQPQYQTQYQPPSQPQFQQGTTTPQPQFQRGTTPQPQFQKIVAPQPQYQPSFTEPTRERTSSLSYPSYTPNSTWGPSSVESAPTPYNYSKNDTQNYQKSTYNSTGQQYYSGYVPPPWEQDSSYTSINNTSEKYYQEVPQTSTFSPASSLGWKPATPNAKYTKNAPIAYVPPAPNQSFVKPVSNIEPPRQPGRKTYYSEYERRYISVPETTYIPTETKFQPQPDPSPHYYYDNNEPTENIEPQWRRELREFKEKTSQTMTTEQSNPQPSWDAIYGKTPSSTYTPTPTWSQTLRPQSYRERSFEAEYIDSQGSKLNKEKPLNAYNDSAVPGRSRGVSVDRYNPNSYQSPAEHPPVQSHTLVAPLPHAGYHNPNVPAYHARTSAEPRELPSSYQQRVYRESRASPLQSRSFKYLQWITGTEN